MVTNQIFIYLSVILFAIKNHSRVLGLPSYCFNYYSEFSLDQDYNPTIYPEVNTTITDITTLYKISEVRIFKLFVCLDRIYTDANKIRVKVVRIMGLK